MQAFLDSQPLLVGLVGAAATGAVLWLLREAPLLAWRRLLSLATTTLVLHSRDAIFVEVDDWLTRRPEVGRARRLMAAHAYDYAAMAWRWRLTLGDGFHLLAWRGRYLSVHRTVQSAPNLGLTLAGRADQTITLRSLGRSHAALSALLEEARLAWYGEDRLRVFSYDRGWVMVDTRAFRSLETVFLPTAQKARLVDDVRRFVASREIYPRRGTPWRRGYLFKGPPGTGKTTLVAALAGVVGRPVYVLNPSSLQGDSDLLAAVNSIEANGVLLIEDVDAIRISEDRSAPPATAAESLAETLKPRTGGLTLSGLLNAIDGVAAREGRILFLTSNHADRLDPALIRPGRVDVVEDIAPLGRAEAAAMIAAFGAPAALLDTLALPIAGAALQARLLAEDAQRQPAFDELEAA